VSEALKNQSADRTRQKLHKSGPTNSIVGNRSEKNFPDPDQRVTALGIDVVDPSEEEHRFSNNRSWTLQKGSKGRIPKNGGNRS
jgi:hypothetical protein